MIDKPAKQYRLPVKFVDGNFELEIGGAVPLVEGARCEVIVSENKISDPKLLNSLRNKKAIKIFDRGTKLVVMLSNSRPEYISGGLRKAALPNDFEKSNLGRWFERWGQRSYHRNFVEIEIGAPDDRQKALPEFDKGGLWLQVEGWRSVGLISSQIILPDCVSGSPAISLNHAFTLLSEAYEPWRISHTGNIYEQILYQEVNEKWYPLYFLRDQKEMEEGQGIAKDHWESFMLQMKPLSRGSK